MKKTYEKPMIIFEDFSLSTSIAAGCEGIVGNPTAGSCAVLGSGGIAVFSSSMTEVCDYTPEGLGQPEDKWDGLCYHVPTEDYTLFNS